MSLSNTGLSWGFGNGALKSAADISANARKWVTVNTSGQVAAVSAAGTGNAILTDGGSASGDYVNAVRGLVEAVAGGTIVAGDRITSDASGNTVKTTGTNQSKGWALTGASSGDPVIIYVDRPYETLTLTAGAESSNVISVTVACSVASAELYAVVYKESTGVPDGAVYKLDETGVGAEVLPSAGGGAVLFLTLDSSGAATIAVTDVAGSTNANALLVVQGSQRTDIPLQRVSLTFDAS